MRLQKSFIIFLIALVFLNVTIIFATNSNNNNISNFFRIHVVANSDSIDDQLLKYQVAKKVDEYISLLTVNCNSKEESKNVIENNIQNILSICKSVITEQGYDYTVKAYIGRIEYDEKQKDDIYMSSGIYDSLKIVIGNGLGNNWWSLIYPTNIDSVITDKTNNSDVEYSIGIVEWLKELFDTNF